MNYEKGISVIVPIYNVEKFLFICLDSIIKQTFKDIEIICVLDKKSSDNSEAIMLDFAKKDNRIKVIYGTEGHGPGYNRNLGMKYVTKEYIGFVDSDDYIDEDFYERLYDNAKIFDADVTVGEVLAYTHNTFIESEWQEHDFYIATTISDMFDTFIQASCWDKIYKTEFLIKNDIKFPENVLYEDTPFLLEMAHKCQKLLTVPGHSYYYWVRNEKSICLNPELEEHRSIDQYRVLDMILDYIYESNIRGKDAEKIILYMFMRLSGFIEKYKDKGAAILKKISKITDIEKFLREVSGWKPTEPVFDSWKKYTEKYYVEKYNGISVIVPVYNAEKTLNKCLDNIRAQTFKNLEIICVLDKLTTDNSENIINEYIKIDNRIKLIKSDKHGNGYCKNLGIEKATKSYLGFVNQESSIDKDFYENLYIAGNVFEANVVSSFIIKDNNSEVKSDKLRRDITIEYTLKQMYLNIDRAICCDKIFLTDLIKNNNIKFQEDSLFDSNPFVLKALLHTNKFVAIADAKYYPSENTDEYREESVNSAYLILTEICDILKDTDIPLEYKSIILEHNIQKYGIKALGYPEYTKILSKKIESVIT